MNDGSEGSSRSAVSRAGRGAPGVLPWFRDPYAEGAHQVLPNKMKMIPDNRRR